jgi:hypothetical protein
MSVMQRQRFAEMQRVSELVVPDRRPSAARLREFERERRRRAKRAKREGRREQRQAELRVARGAEDRRLAERRAYRRLRRAGLGHESAVTAMAAEFGIDVECAERIVARLPEDGTSETNEVKGEQVRS